MGINEGMDFGRPSPAGASQGVISGFIGQIRVIRLCPLCGPQRARRPRVGERGCWSNRSIPMRPGQGHQRCRRVRGPRRTSPRRCHRSTSVDDVPKPIATHQVQEEHPATARQYGSAKRSPPASLDDHSRADLAAPPTTASRVRPQPRTNQKSPQYESFLNDRVPTAKSLADTP
jgi:hypothetical protein